MNSGHSFQLNTHTPQELPFRETIEKLVNAALESVDPFRAVKNFFRFDGQTLTIGAREYVRSDYKQIYLIAIGKAAVPMIRSAAEILGEDFTYGLAVSKTRQGSESMDSRIRLVLGDHPVPGMNSIGAANEVLALLEKVIRNDMVIFLISGGGSALITKPAPGVTFESMQDVTQCLLKASVPI